MKQYRRGTTVTIEAKHYADGQLVDADSAKIVIADEAGKVVVDADTDMTKESQGVYYYKFDTSGLATLGVYAAEAILETDGDKSRERTEFEILESIE